MRHLAHTMTLGIAVLLCGAAFAYGEVSELRKTAQQVYAELELMSDTSRSIHSGVIRAIAARQISRLGADAQILAAAREQNTSPANAWEAEELMRLYRFDEARPLLAALATDSTDEARTTRYRWLLLTEDLRRVDSLSQAELKRDSTDAVAEFARGELLLRMLKYDGAAAVLERACNHDASWDTYGAIRIALAKAYAKRKEYQRAADTLMTLMAPQTLTAEVLFQLGSVLIDLSRVSEAIDLFEEAVRWNPDHELAHYYLGNGYARLNYTQLHEKYPKQYGDPAVLKKLSPALADYANGDVAKAKELTQTLTERNQDAVEPPSLLASIWWNEEQFDSAASYFWMALKRCPEYGRAHSGLAKSLEAKRMRVNVHRQEDAARFASFSITEITGIETFVANWKSLSPRHQKQVALAVEPWKLYIPVLVESGHRYYIKPLHERLSQSPGLETLKDQRIGYDSRLWDDVRGCGGYTTVTGIEDVERSIYANYNTVLHELTHQVHGVFPPEDAQKLTDAYHSGRNREEAGEKVFMSQYQAASVWEYFAEGANGYYSPRRDEYDTREIVRERLFQMDTTLVHLVEYYVTALNLDACYPVGLVNAAQDAMERNKLSEALTFAEKGYARAPQAEVVLSALSNVYSIRDDDTKALAYADSLLKYHPNKAGGYSGWYSAKFFADGEVKAGIERLKLGLAAVDSTERKAIHQALGNAYWYAGDYASSAKHYQKILDLQSGDSDALWGLGVALGDAKKFAEADSAFQKALAERSGIAELRLDYARILIAAGRLADAETQISEAELLTPGDAAVMTTQGWLAAAQGDWSAALAKYEAASKDAPYDRLPSLLRVEALRQAKKESKASKALAAIDKQAATDIPQWVYEEKNSTYKTGYAWPHFMRELLTSFHRSSAKVTKT